MNEKLVKATPHDVALPADPIDALVQKAVETGAVDVLERLLAVRRQVQADRARDAFYTSLIAFQTACPVISKSTTANIKPGFSYRYCPIEEIAHAIRPLLEQFQLGYRWFAAQQGNQLTVTCRISHALGHIEETSLTVPVGIDPMRPAWPVAQSLTYAKRYTLCNALGIVVGGEDDDAQEPVAEAPKHPEAAQQPSTPRPATAQPPASAAAGTSGPIISELQAKRLYAIAMKAGWNDEDIHQCIKLYGYEHTRDITRKDYEAICTDLERRKPAGPTASGPHEEKVPF